MILLDLAVAHLVSKDAEQDGFSRRDGARGCRTTQPHAVRKVERRTLQQPVRQLRFGLGKPHERV